MKISASWQQRQVAACLVIFLAVPFAQAADARPQPAPVGQQATSTPAAQTQSPDPGAGSPAATPSQPTATPSASKPPASDDADQDETPEALPSAPQQQQQNGNSNPVGTAAAPYEKTTGVAASRPAGAVVAPAKQKRSRSFLIRVALIAGACVAVGVVVGLSAASPSRP